MSQLQPLCSGLFLGNLAGRVCSHFGICFMKINFLEFWTTRSYNINRYRMTLGVRHSGIVNWLIYLFIVMNLKNWPTQVESDFEAIYSWIPTMTDLYSENLHEVTIQDHEVHDMHWQQAQYIDDTDSHEVYSARGTGESPGYRGIPGVHGNPRGPGNPGILENPNTTRP